MYGAILGDIIGSPFEFDRGNKTKTFNLFSRGCGFTDDSVMTIAVGEALLAVGKEATVEEIKEAVTVNMRDWGKKYPNAGYGGSFWHWLRDKHPRPYGSYGNGSAMRVSAAGWLYDSLERTREVARATADVTHNHPEGVKGAEATASCIFLARRGFSKDEIRSYVETKFHYNLDRTLDAIRPYYHHVESCQETVPEAIIAFLEAKNFEDTIRNAVSLGGDTDTLGAIAGSIAEAFYGIPDDLKNECRTRIPKGMLEVLDIFDERLGKIQGTLNDYKGMAKVEFAIEKIYSEVRQENMIDFLGTIAYAMQEDLQCMVPGVLVEGDLLGGKEPEELQAGDVVTLGEDCRIRLDTVMDQDKKEFYYLLTSDKVKPEDMECQIFMWLPIKSVIYQAYNSEKCEGLVVNPFGKYVKLDKPMLQHLVDTYEQFSGEE